MPQTPSKLHASLALALIAAGIATAVSAATPPASAPATTRARGAAAPAAPAVLPPLQPWARPADGPALFTEDFESGTLDNKKWTLHATGAAKVAVQQSLVAHGKNALMVTYPAGTTRSVGFITAKIPEALKDHFYGRAYMFINAVPDPHSVFVLGGTTGYPDAANWLEIGSYQGHWQPSLQITAPTPEKPRGEVPLHQGTLPIGKWFCMEWEFIDKPDRIVVWVDGKLDVNVPVSYAKITNATVSKDSGLIGGFAEFSLGYRTFAQGTAITKDLTICYDDIAIGDKPIGQLAPVVAPAK